MIIMRLIQDKCQLNLHKKAGCGVERQFELVFLVSNVFVEPSMDLTPAFARTQSQEEDILEG